MKDKFRQTFRALSHKNFRLFFIGQCISLVGTWIQQVALSWLIYSLTKSPLLMGLITFTSSIPALIISPFAGVEIDRVNKYHAMIVVQIVFLIESLILAILTILGVIKIWHIVILSVLFGITASIDMPLRHSFVIYMVEGNKDLGNAISLNSSSFNLARLVGPAIAGILIAAVGEGACFLINAISYIAVIAALFAMDIHLPPLDNLKKLDVLKELKEGFSYVYESIIIKNVILFIAIGSFVGMSYQVLMPVFIKEVLHKDAQTLGFAMSAAGIGALIGALYLAARKSIIGLENWMLSAAVLFGLGLVGLKFTSNEFVAFLLLFMTGFGMVVVIASCNTLIQHCADDDKRGRVMSIYTMAFMGTAPIGSLCYGAIAEKIGVTNTFLVSGLTILAFTLLFTRELPLFKQEIKAIRRKRIAEQLAEQEKQYSLT